MRYRLIQYTSVTSSRHKLVETDRQCSVQVHDAVQYCRTHALGDGDGTVPGSSAGVESSS